MSESPWLNEDPASLQVSEGALVKALTEQERAGVKVEAEHADVYDFFAALLKKNGLKMPLTRKEFFLKIVRGHTREIGDYYLPWLKRMEEEAKAAGKKKAKVDEAKVEEWVSKHEAPEDEEFHAFAEKSGWDKHEAEEAVYRLAHRLLAGKKEG